MTTLIAIDPGVKECACAEFVDGELIEVWFTKLDPKVWDRTLGHTASRVVVEKPQLDKRPPMHVIDLAWSGALVAASFRAPITAYTPSQWKKSTPKPVSHARAWAVLTPEERAVFPADTEARIRAAQEKGAKDRWRKPGGSYYGAAKGCNGIGAGVHNLLDAMSMGLFHLGRLGK